MPIDYRQDDRRRIVVATSVGHVTQNDVLAIIDRQVAGGAWTYGMVYDTRGSDDVPSKSDLLTVVTRIGTLTTKHGPRGPVALVATAAAMERTGRRYAHLGELTALDVAVFATVEDAEEWLASR